ncbi:Protection of telomeres protein 1a-like protein [Drosera capensis]
MGGGGDEIQYVSILDAFSSVHRRVNLVDVVLEFSVPKRSKGTGITTISSHSTDSISLARSLKGLLSEPAGFVHDFVVFGDVVCVVVLNFDTGDEGGDKEHDSALAAFYNICYHVLIFVVAPGRNGKSFTPYQIYSKFQVKGLDKSLISGLRKWRDDLPLNTASQQSVQLKGIKLTDCADLVCKVREWKGSSGPFTTGRCAFAKGHLMFISYVRVDPKYVDLSTCTGGWVKFITLSFQVHKRWWYDFCNPSPEFILSRIKTLIIISDYEERLSSKFGRMPSSSFPWPSPFTGDRCVAQVVDAFMWNVEDFLSPSGICRLRLMLEDPTGRLHAYVYSEDGEMFFNGFPLIHEMRRRRNMLLGIQENDNGDELEDAPRSPPRIELCITSYTMSIKVTRGEVGRYLERGSTAEENPRAHVLG